MLQSWVDAEHGDLSASLSVIARVNRKLFLVCASMLMMAIFGSNSVALLAWARRVNDGKSKVER